uniref:Uncharacterized protein n=1 Tax=Cacopsylla melanoneura TaxID=428564 RepID=A0A8D8REZ0_9HEMI
MRKRKRKKTRMKTMKRIRRKIMIVNWIKTEVMMILIVKMKRKTILLKVMMKETMKPNHRILKTREENCKNDAEVIMRTKRNRNKTMNMFLNTVSSHLNSTTGVKVK